MKDFLLYERIEHPNQFPSDYFFSALAELVLDAFRTGIDSALGEGACLVLSIRPQGGVEAFAK